MKQLVHSVSDDNNIAPFDFQWIETILKCEKVTRDFYDWLCVAQTKVAARYHNDNFWANM